MRLLLLLLTICLFTACKDRQESAATPPEETDIPAKIAQAHGIENWSRVRELKFTFNVDRDTTHYERSWTWWPQRNEAEMVAGNDTTKFNTKQPDSVHRDADASFVNDKFWLLLPFQLEWDRGDYQYEVAENAIAPISGDSLSRLTIVYGEEGGYTPGDAYDIFYDQDHRIREWTFRKGNQKEPSMTTTWEDYQAVGPLRIATRHEGQQGGMALYFTDLGLSTE